MNQKYIPPITLLACFISCLPVSVFAAEAFDQAGIWAGVDVGGGNVKTAIAGVEETSSAFYLGFKLHYRLAPHYLVGFELSGFTIETGNVWDPGKGEAISQALIVAHYYPQADAGLFFKAGGGYVSHWNNAPDVSGRMRGSGYTLGAGYDYPIQNDWALTPFVSFCFAKTDGEDHNAWTLGIGLSSRFWP